MATLHVRNRSGNIINCIIHFDVPTGNNAVGFSWKNIVLALGRNTTSMVEGSGIGQISTTEKASVVAGDILELSISVTDHGGNASQRAAAIDEQVAAIIVDESSRLKQEFNFYGMTRG